MFVVSQDILDLYIIFMNCDIYRHIRVDCKVFVSCCSHKTPSEAYGNQVFITVADIPV